MPVKLSLTALRAKIEADGVFEAALLLADSVGDKRPETLEEANASIEVIFQSLVSQNRYEDAGFLLWGGKLWRPEVSTVRAITKLFVESDSGLITGSGSLGKSFTTAGIFYMDWRRDPAWTSTKVISQTLEHGKKNIFATMKMLHEAACVPLSAEVLTQIIRVNPLDDRFGLMQIAIPKGASGEGVLKGFHPIPRPTPHPVFGKASRVRALIDEGEHVPPGVWTGADNMLLSKEAGGTGNIKVFSVTNPFDRTTEFARRSEPAKGYARLDPEVDFRWKSGAGWDVLRLDASKFENVVTGKDLFPGFITKSGFDQLIASNGIDSVAYWTLGRGMYAPEGTKSSIISPGMLDRGRGTLIWIERPIVVAALDPAFLGGDKAIFSTGLCGLAAGWRDAIAVEYKFVYPRRAVQLESQVQIERGDTAALSARTIVLLRAHNVLPGCFAIDASGIGEGVASNIKRDWGQLIAIISNGVPSEEKIFEEDDKTADEAYSDKGTEIWFAARKFIDASLFMFALALPTTKLFEQMTARTYALVGSGKVKVSKKELDKIRGESPDYADSATLLVEAARRAVPVFPKKKDRREENEGSEPEKIPVGFSAVAKPPEDDDDEDEFQIDKRDRSTWIDFGD